MATRLLLHQLEQLAQSAGFEDYKSMLYQYYVVDEMGLMELAKRCSLGTERLKRHLSRFGIEVRGRGGANNVKVVITPELLQEVMQDGITAVARRLDVQPSRLTARLREHTLNAHKQEG